MSESTPHLALGAEPARFGNVEHAGIEAANSVTRGNEVWDALMSARFAIA
jgi:hypothetical protein